jgi:uncharacterized protein YoxC
METLRLVLEIVALSAVSVVSVYLIVVLIRVRSILDVVEHNMKEINSKAIPVLDNLEFITDKFKTIAETISEQVDGIQHTMSSLKEVADDIVAFERQVQERIEHPVMEVATTIAAIFRGIQSFIEHLPFVSRLRAEQ